MQSTPKEIALFLAQTADGKKARDITVLEVTDLTVLADYFVIVTGTSNTHIKTLSQEIEHVMKERGAPPHHVEGYLSGNWVLLDFGCVIVHIFAAETREFYALERMWSDAVKVEWA